MLDAFKKLSPAGRGAGTPVDDLQALVAAAREERAALSTMLAQVQLRGSKLAAAGTAFEDVDARVARTLERIEAIAERLAGMGDLAAGIERAAALLARVPELEARMDALAARLSGVDRAVVETARAITAVDAIDGRLSTLATAVEAMEARQQETASHVEALDARAERLQSAASHGRGQQGVRAAADRGLLADLHGRTAEIAAGLEAARLQMATVGEPRAAVGTVLAAFAEIGGLVQQAASKLGPRQAGATTFERK